MKYSEYNDFELISYVREQNEEAFEIIYEKYKPLIIKIAKKVYRNTYGIDIKDLISEGMLGVYRAIMHYNDSNISFYIYVKMCIINSILSLIRRSYSMKNKILNEAVSYDNSKDDFNLDDIIGDINTPEKYLLDEEIKKESIDKIKSILTNYEFDVFKLKLEGFNYREIAKFLNKDPKNIDNALTRIKKKLEKERQN